MNKDHIKILISIVVMVFGGLVLDLTDNTVTGIILLVTGAFFTLFFLLNAGRV